MFSPDAFSSDFELPDEPQDAPSEEPTEGPWISHGVIHLAHPPLNH